MTSTCERSLPVERERPPGVEPDGLDRSASSCAATLGLQQIETLFEELFEFLDRATLEQHVPVGAGRLDLLGFGGSSLHEGAFEAVAAQPGAGATYALVNFSKARSAPATTFSLLGT